MQLNTVFKSGSCAVVCAGLALSVLAYQAPTNPAQPQNGVLHFNSHLGSFKFFNGDGTVKFSFEGTVLIRNYQGHITVSPNVQLQYDKNGRKAYFGQGTFAFTGHFESIQWFGRNLDGEWDGRGGFRVYGDYDKNMETGWFWFGNDVAGKQAWPTQGSTMILPQQKGPGNIAPVLKQKGH